MAIVKVQSVTGAGPTLVLNGVVAGNCLTYQGTYFRGTSTGLAEAAPTDTNGTFVVGRADTPQVLSSQDCGASGFYQKNCAAGTHTVTPEANGGLNGTLTEWSGVDTVSPLIAGNSGKNTGTGTSQATGASASASSGDLALIQHGMAATITGNANVGYTDPVANYTTLQKVLDDASNVATFHLFRVLSAGGTENATFNWTYSQLEQFWQASIFVLKAASTSAPLDAPQLARPYGSGLPVQKFPLLMRVWRPQQIEVEGQGRIDQLAMTPPLLGRPFAIDRMGGKGALPIRTWRPAPLLNLAPLTTIGNAFTQGLTATLSFIGTQAHAVSKLMTAALSFIGARASAITKGMTAALSFIGNFVKSTSKGLAAATLSFISAFVIRTNKLMTAAMSFIGAQSRVVAKGMTAALSFIGSLPRAVSKGMTAALSFIGAQARKTSKFMTAALSFIGVLTGGHLFATALTATLSFIGGFASVKLLLQSLTAALSFSGAFSKRTSKGTTAALSFIGSSSRQIAKQMTAAANFVGAYVARTSKQLSATALSFVGSVNLQARKLMTAALSFIGAITAGRAFLKALAAALSFAGAFGKLPKKAFSAILSWSGAIATGKQLFGPVWKAARRTARWVIGQR